MASDPESGAVFRCEPDGSNLEVVATGLRNPQELAFDDLGHCFTCDNNTDGGDRTRLVHVIPGGDSGWRGPVQYLSDRGPFNREQLWRTAFDGQPAWIVPPMGHVGAGPAGFAAYPGTGLTPWFDGRFFLADFRGAVEASPRSRACFTPHTPTRRRPVSMPLRRGLGDSDGGDEGAR